MRTDVSGGIYARSQPESGYIAEGGICQATRAAGYSYSDMILRISESVETRRQGARGNVCILMTTQLS
jgi:hypothetical protein